MTRRSARAVKEHAAPERGIVLRAVIITLAGAMVYVNSLNAPFIFDDTTAIVDNQQIRQLWPLSVPLSPRRDTPVAGRPIVNLSFAVNYAFGGLDVTEYRLFNLAIHLLAALTLFGIARRTLRLPSLAPAFGGRETNLAWVIALIWMLHPLQTETIDYVTQRTESLMGLFYLLTLYCSVRALGTSSGRWQAAAIVACATGMACKESMVTAPVIVMLYDWVFVGWAALRTMRRTRLYVGLASTWLVLAALLASGPRTTAGFDTSVSPWAYLLNQAPILLDYLRLTFWPVHLVLDYGIPRPLTLGDVVLPFALIAALAVVVVVLLVRRPHAGFLGAWCFITLSPTSSIVPIATEVGAERRMYLPLAGLVALVVLSAYRAWVARGATRPAIVGPAVAVVACLALAIGTVQRNREYESSISILRTAVERRPHPRSNLMIGTVLLEAGRREEAMPYLERARDEPGSSFVLGIDLIAQAKFADGANELERFLRLQPMHVRAIDAREALGRAYAALGDVDRAATNLTEVVRRRPERAPAHTYLGEVLLRQGRVADGVREFQIAADLQPGNPDTLRLLGIAQGQSGQLDAAVATFKRAIAIDPLNARGHYLLGSALAAAGQVAAAVPSFARAVELDPQNAQARADLERAQRHVR
jgi:tetratricopeptide (TPR) repeat protein